MVTLASASMDATIRLWDVATQKQLEALPYKESQVNAICITPDGAQLLVGAWQYLRIYDLQCPTPQGLHTFSVHEKNVTAVGFQEDGAWMYTGGEDCMAKIWDMRVNQLNCQRIFQVDTPVHSVVLHPNQVELIVADSKGSIYLWDLRSDRDDSLVTEVEMSEYIVHVDIDRLGRQCAAVTNRGHLFLWDVSHTGMMIAQNSEQPSRHSPKHIVQQHQTELAVKEFDGTGEIGVGDAMSATTGMSPSPIAPPPELLGAFQIPTQQQEKVPIAPSLLPIPHQIHQPVPSQLQPMPPLISHPRHSALTLINNASKCTKLRAHKTFALKCHFRPDGLAVATTSADQTTKLWSANTHKMLNSYSVPGNKWVWDCAFTNNSNYMITATSDGILRMWELASGSVVRTYQGHSMGITAMAFKDCR